MQIEEIMAVSDEERPADQSFPGEALIEVK